MNNILLSASREEYESTGRTMRLPDYNKCIVELKRNDKRFKTAHSQVLQEVGHRLGKSLQEAHSF